MRGVVLRLLSALLAGCLLALAFPLSVPDLPLPFGPLPLRFPGWDAAAGFSQLPWLAFIALVPLMEIARQSRRPLEAFLWGYLGGFCWLLLHVIWLGSFGVAPVVLMALFFALPTGLFTAAAHWLIQAGGASRLLWGLPCVWVGLEYLRSFGFWAFPWNLLGYSQVGALPLIQIAELGGVYAVSFVVALVNSALFLLLTPLAGLRRRIGFALLSLGVVLLVLAYGELRLNSSFTDYAAPPLRLALVQGGLGTRERWSEDLLNRMLQTYIPLSDGVLMDWDAGHGAAPAEAGLLGPANEPELLVVWPETALLRSVDPRRPERLPPQVRSLLQDREHSALLVGTIGRPQDDEHAENGCLLVTPDGELQWPYAKLRPVAYGEVVPFREIVRFLQYPWGTTDLTGGRSMQPLSWQGHKLGLMICFDNVFGFVPRGEVRAGAEALVLVTNNSWYALNGGVRQHCDLDVFRAVECRRPLARVSTTGWSHLIDPAGAIVQSTNVDSEGLITAWLRPGRTVTPYLIVGDLFAQLCLLAALLLVARSCLSGRSEGFL